MLPVRRNYGGEEINGQNSTREPGEWLIAMIEKAAGLPAPHAFDKPREFKSSAGQVVSSARGGLHDAVEQLKRLGKPFLNWTGKAERLSFELRQANMGKLR